MANRATDTKLRIIKASRSLFSTHGCDSTTLDEIITASGITKGAFYHYFKSKGSLCETIVDEVIADYRKLTQSIDAEAEPIVQLLEMIGKLEELNASGEWVNCRLIVRISADSHESYPELQNKLRDFWQWYTRFFEDLIARCIEAGQLSKRLDAETQTRLLMSMLAGNITLQRIAPEQTTENPAKKLLELLQV